MRFRFFFNRQLISGAFATLALLLASCGHSPQDQRDTVDSIIDLAIGSMDGQTIEFPRLYDVLFDTIPSDENEKLILVEKLKQRGFTISDYGRGNFPPLVAKDHCRNHD